MITRYTSPHVKEPAPKLWSNCMVCDGIAYIAGLTSRNDDGVTIDGKDEYEQTKIIFQKHKALIEAAGGKMERGRAQVASRRNFVNEHWTQVVGKGWRDACMHA